MASGIKGVSKLRRKLRRIPDEVEGGVRTSLEMWATAIEQDAIAGAPVEEGDMVRSIGKRFSADRLAGVVGPGVRGAEIARRRTGSPFATRRAGGTEVRMSRSAKHDLFQFFKAHWYEFGTKGDPENGIPPQPARPFMGPAYLLNEEYGKRLMRAAVKDALRRASGG